jgi:hypothetical protein
LKDIREVSWHDQEGKKQQKKAGSRYRLIATGDTTTAKRFRTLNKCFINSPAAAQARVYYQFRFFAGQSDGGISLRDY